MKNKRPNSWKRLIDALPHGVLIINGEGQIIYANASSAALFGTTRQKLIGTSFLYPLAAEETGEIEILRKDRTITSAQMTVREGAWQEEPAWIVALHDITELKDKEKRLSVVSKGVSSAFEGIVITDAQGTILEANQAFLNMSGFKKEDILGQNPRMWKSGKQDAQFYKHLWERLSSEGHWSGELWDKGGHNKLYPVFLSVSAVKNEAGDVTNYIGFFHDLTVIKQQEKQIEHVKYYDLLTGLPNKFLLTQKLEGFMRQASRQQKNLLVMNIRVFDPKTRKSSYEEPPHVRDAIIIHAVNRIKEVLRQRKMLARTGYSEFVGICLEQGDTVDNAAILAGQLIKSLSKPYHIENKTYRLKTHIGITAYEANSACHAEELLHQGEIARHKARQKGDNSFDFFDPQFEKSLLEFSRHLEAVRGALKKNQLRLFYQPKVDLLTGNVIGVEALLRWMHPVRGLLLPHQFLLRLDNHPISLELGEWTLNHALKMAGQFLSHDIEIPISINVGSHELQHKNYFHHFMTIMKKYPRIPKKMILLEVLETEAIEDLDLVSDLINRFKAQGIHFALDDFGKKYSSLAYLKELDTREVKLDQSFIRDIFDKPKDLAILLSVIRLCKILDRPLVAEGVETITHGKLLLQLGCNLAQGHAIAKPMPEDEIIPWVKNWKLGAEWTANRFSHAEYDEIIAAAIEHFIAYQKLERFLYDGVDQIPDFNVETCKILKWLQKHKSRFQDGDTCNTLYDLHKKQHQWALEIISLAEAGKQLQARRLYNKLMVFRNENLKKMVTAIFTSQPLSF